MKIEKEIEIFLEKALPIMPAMDDITEEECFRCGNKMRFPLIAKSRHIKAFEQLLKIADEYLEDHGASIRMLATILDKAIEAKKDRVRNNLKLVKGGVDD